MADERSIHEKFDALLERVEKLEGKGKHEDSADEKVDLNKIESDDAGKDGDKNEA